MHLLARHVYILKAQSVIFFIIQNFRGTKLFDDYAINTFFQVHYLVHIAFVCKIEFKIFIYTIAIIMVTNAQLKTLKKFWIEMFFLHISTNVEYRSDQSMYLL
jgi:hypothetical protein